MRAIASDYARSRLRMIRAHIDLAVPRLIKIHLERTAFRAEDGSL
jgi:hypothetical protein